MPAVNTSATRLFFGALVALTMLSGTALAQVLPTDWATKDIGSVGMTGAASGTPSAFSVSGAGADIWDSSDQFRYLYKPMTGDGTIVTQVANVPAVNAWTKAGVMIRETLATNSRHAMVVVSNAKGIAFQRRTATGGLSVHTGTTGAAPYYVKLTRAGSLFTAAKSVDGVTWTTFGSETIAMTSTVYVGLAVTSHTYGVLATVNFVNTVITTPDAAPEPAPEPVPQPVTPPTTTKLRVLHWNSQHGGRRTDGVYDPNGFANWMNSWNVDVISLNEVDNTTQMTTLVNLMTQKSGKTWNYKYDGRGNAVMSTLPLTTGSICLTNATVGRKAAHLSVLVNNRPLNLWSGHFALDSSAMRLAEAVALQACEQLYFEARISAMDFNAQADTPEYNSMVVGHTDAWRAAPTKINYPGNCDGCTRNSRIDYVFTSRGASWLTLKSAQIVDTRNASGVAASDHKPMIIEYVVAN
jgi:endonuclease/exonuclease/phosphatase family metal-dependent hydrolase